MYEDIAAAIKEKRLVPFFGSGLSANLGVPTWQGLIDKMGQELEFDPEVFSSSGAQLYTLAEYYKAKKGNIGDIRSWMDRHFNADDEAVGDAEIFSIIADLRFPVIYTTNYDRNIETAHKIRNIPHHTIKSIEDLVNHKSNKTDIVKLHGDFSNDSSIVITESDYYERMNFENPLDIELRNDLIGKSALFFGYSLTDINIRFLLYKISKLWSGNAREDIKPIYYIFMNRPDEIQQTVLDGWGVKAVFGQTEDPALAGLDFFRKLAQ